MHFNDNGNDSAIRMRYRKKLSNPPSSYEEPYRPLRRLPIPCWHFSVFFFAMALLYFGIVMMERRLPAPLYTKDEPANPSRFIAERAQTHLRELTGMGPRTVGSYENEVLAVKFLAREIGKVANKTDKRRMKMAVDFQKVSGAFPLTFLDGMTNVYKDVQNVVVKIGPVAESEHSLLVNCHFDTVIDSPGGSDDGASCAIMLEMLRVISRMPEPPAHNIIFLFNGAEENFLQASHGFITQHKWAGSVRAFINLEACGAGGREILFQAGPKHPWLLQAYSDVVPYPLASSLAQEIFQSGLVPGDTDFRIFRDFGHIPGLDFAWSSNGYVYHTKLDDIHQIPLGTLQRTGDNILPLVLRIANSKQLANTEAYSQGNLVYFDFLGAFMISCTEMAASFVNVAIAGFTFFTVWFNIKNMQNMQGYDKKRYLSGVWQSIAFAIASWVAAIVTCAGIAFSLSYIHRSMSWFARPVWIFFLYAIPTFITPVCVLWLFTRRFQGISSVTLFQMYLDGLQILFACISLGLTLFRVRSCFIVSIWLFFSCWSWITREKLFPLWRKDHRLLWLHAGALLLPYVLTGYVVNAVEMLVIPIMGRSGSGNMAEIVLACIMSAILSLEFSFFVPLLILVENGRAFVKGLTGIFVLSLMVLLFTPLGFPYSADITSPAPQRYIIPHVERAYYHMNGTMRHYETGLWIVNMDVNSPRIVIPYVAKMQDAIPLDRKDCMNELYCGLPYMLPVSTIMWQTHWIPAGRPNIPRPASLKLQYKDARLENVTRLSFVASGPDHMNLFVAPVEGVMLKAWSLLEGEPLKGPTWKGRPTYFAYYSYGSSEAGEWAFWLDLQVEGGDDKKNDGALVEVALCGHVVHGEHKNSKELANLLDKFPAWTTTSGWTATYKSYKF